MSITNSQREILKAWWSAWKKHGYQPSYEELMALMGFSSKSAVAYHFEKLRKEGVLKDSKRKARMAELTDKGAKLVGML